MFPHQSFLFLTRPREKKRVSFIIRHCFEPFPLKFEHTLFQIAAMGQKGLTSPEAILKTNFEGPDICDCSLLICVKKLFHVCNYFE